MVDAGSKDCTEARAEDSTAPPPKKATNTYPPAPSARAITKSDTPAAAPGVRPVEEAELAGAGGGKLVKVAVLE